MPRFTQGDAECRVFTFKEGLLSAIAHDLEIAVERFSIDVDEGRTKIDGTWDATSLRVLHAQKDGAPSPGSLSDRDKQKIESNIASDVLETSRWREIRFTSSAIEQLGEAFVVRGTLELHGRSRAIEARVTREGGRWITEVTLHQPDFGITPYSAMMGTLRIKPEVRVRVAVPA